jgi:lysophospholipase L1-like esterase
LKFPAKIPFVLVLAVMAACSSSQSLPTAPTPPTTQPPTTPPPTTPPPTPFTPRTSRTRYLAFGDSLTAGTTSPAVGLFRTMSAGLPESYPFKLQAMLGGRYTAQTIQIENEGRPGEAAEDGVRRFSSVLRTANPEVVILLHGVNDVSFQGLPGVPRTAGFINTMAREARLTGKQVMICTLPPNRSGGFRAADPAVIAAYNRALRDIARGEGAILVDFEALFDLRLIGMDGLHPTEPGYTRMAEILFAQARRLFEIAP